jgi:hypothetical protein
VPELSRFLGIVIAMYYRDHGPPHFHAICGDHEATVEIASGEVSSGSLPPRAMGRVHEWRVLRRDELMRCWRRAVAQLPLEKIAPLE